MKSRVSIRTLALMLELLGFLLAYQFMVVEPQAKPPARAAAAGPQRPADVNAPDRQAPEGPVMTMTDLPADIGDCTPALRAAIEGRRSWGDTVAADPNDRIEPADAAPGPEEVE